MNLVFDFFSLLFKIYLKPNLEIDSVACRLKKKRLGLWFSAVLLNRGFEKS